MTNTERMQLTTRRYNKQTYTFYLNKLTSGQLYVTCETPPNCFGYPDIVLLASPSYNDNFTPRAYTLYRTLPNWILNKIEAMLIKLAKEYTNEI